MSAVVWEDPPQSRHGRGSDKFLDFADTLRANPGRWAVLPKDSPNGAAARVASSNINRGSYKAFARGEFESTCRDLKVYVRFVGDAS